MGGAEVVGWGGGGGGGRSGGTGDDEAGGGAITVGDSGGFVKEVSVTSPGPEV